MGQEPEPEDFTEKTGEDRARVSYALAHGQATGADSAAARVYGVLDEAKPEKPQTPAQILTERKALATMKYATDPTRMSRADSVYAGIKEEQPKPEKTEALGDRVIRYANRRKSINANLPDPRFNKNAATDPASIALQSIGAEYDDSLRLANDALKAQKEWLPQYEKMSQELGEVEARKWLLKTTGSSPEELISTIKLFQ